jgi:hypothetical protein
MIRAQYHFRRTPDGLLAWDVRRLIKITSGLPVRQIAVASIDELNEDHWYSHGATKPTCKSIVEHSSLIQSADLSYPIILDSAGRVMDGMHRVCKAYMQGRTHIAAVQFQQDPEPDFINREPESLPYTEE